MKLKVKLDDGAFAPEKAYATDAGFDLRTPVDVTIYPRSSAVVNTGVHIDLPPSTMGDIDAKSGLNVKRDILTYGVIDEGYNGAVVVKLYNLGSNTQHFKRGDKIAQLVVKQIPELDGIEIVDEIVGGERGDNGFGSTGR